MPEMVYKEYVVQQNIVSAKLTFARICFILILTIIVSECVFLLDIARSPCPLMNMWMCVGKLGLIHRIMSTSGRLGRARFDLPILAII